MALGSFFGLLAVLGGLYGALRYRQYAAILPPKPEGAYDTYGTAAVQPRRKAGEAARRRHRAEAGTVGCPCARHACCVATRAVHDLSLHPCLGPEGGRQRAAHRTEVLR